MDLIGVTAKLGAGSSVIVVCGKCGRDTMAAVFEVESRRTAVALAPGFVNHRLERDRLEKYGLVKIFSTEIGEYGLPVNPVPGYVWRLSGHAQEKFRRYGQPEHKRRVQVGDRTVQARNLATGFPCLLRCPYCQTDQWLTIEALQLDAEGMVGPPDTWERYRMQRWDPRAERFRQEAWEARKPIPRVHRKRLD